MLSCLSLFARPAYIMLRIMISWAKSCLRLRLYQTAARRLEYETDSNDIYYARIDRTRKIPVTVLIRALGFGTDAEIIDLFGEDERLIATMEKDTTKTHEEGLLEVYRRLRPGEPPTVDSAQSLISSTFFDPKRYDMAKVGRDEQQQKADVKR